jgi:hypothetical protein
MIMVFSSFVDKLIVSLIVEMICMGNFSSSDEMVGLLWNKCVFRWI